MPRLSRTLARVLRLQDTREVEVRLVAKRISDDKARRAVAGEDHGGAVVAGRGVPPVGQGQVAKGFLRVLGGDCDAVAGHSRLFGFVACADDGRAEA